MKAHISAHNGSCALRRLHNSRPGEDNGGQKQNKKSLLGVSQRDNTRRQIPQISRDIISQFTIKNTSSLHIHSFVLHGPISRETFGLTLGFPEDPRAHELEEATGVEAGPVDGDGVLRTDRWDVKSAKAKTERLNQKAAVAPEPIHLRRRTPGPSTSVPAS